MRTRIPVMLWGDLVRGRKPILRRALAGDAAHECMYAWVYLTDYLAHRKLRDAISTAAPDDVSSLLADFDLLAWARWERAKIDRNFQVSKEGFCLSGCVAAIARQISTPKVVELGSTFFASRLKNEIVRRAFGDEADPEWIGLDNGALMHDMTALLHPEARMVVHDDYQKYSGDSASIFLARFVASYVIRNTQSLANYVAPFAAVVIEDAFATSDADTPVENHGQPETFYSLSRLVDALGRSGFSCFLLASYPDHPAHSAPCHVVKFLAVRDSHVVKFLAVRDSIDIERIAVDLNSIGIGFDPTSARLSETSLANLNASVSEARWTVIRQAKRESPVWGPTPEDYRPLKGWRLALNRLTGELGPWGNYRLSGPQAVAQIKRALEAARI